MHESELRMLAKKLLDADRIIHEQQLGVIRNRRRAREEREHHAERRPCRISH